MSRGGTVEFEHSDVRLPGGLVLDDGSRLDRVALRPLSGHEEDWLARHPNAASAVAVTKVLSSCLQPDVVALAPLDFARQLLVGDRDHLMLQLRRMTLGDRVAAVYVCPECDSKMDVTLDLAEVTIEESPQDSATHAVTLDGGRTVRFRLPVGRDQEAVAALALDDAIDFLVSACLLDEHADNLDADERVALVDEMERVAPRLDVELELECPECAHPFTTDFDPASFFIAELATSRDSLLREVHHLAFHYGWSEAAILAMDRGRRRAYLSLLFDELDQEPK